MVRWASKRHKTDNPTEQILNVDVPNKNPPRQRYHSHDELRAIWLACDKLGFPFGPATQRLALLGVREMQVGALPWSELDLDAAEWLIPAAARHHLAADVRFIKAAFPLLDRDAKNRASQVRITADTRAMLTQPPPPRAISGVALCGSRPSSRRARRRATHPAALALP